MYRCKNCYHGVDEDNLNSIFQCPVCGVEREMFEKIKQDDPYKGVPIDINNKAINRIDEKCINCGRCSFICQNVTGVKYDYEKQMHPICLNCGACIQNCPTGAIVPKYSYGEVFEMLNDPNKIVVVSTSPAVRVALGEEFKMEYGTFVEGRMVTALKELGFDYVLDTTFGADLTTMEEATELLERIKNNQKLPQFSSCCPSWVKYLEIYHPEYLNNLSTCKSPIGMQGSIVKTYFAEQKNLLPQNIIHVALTPCTAKKYEISRSELNSSSIQNQYEGLNDTDYVITTSELGLMIKEKNIDFKNLGETEFDQLLNKGSQGGMLFGQSSGVTTSVIRTLYYLVTKEELKEKLEFNDTETENLKELRIKIGEYNIRVAIIQGMITAEKMLNKLGDYHFVEVMNCHEGCVGGAGQPLTPINKYNEAVLARKNSLVNNGNEDILRASYQNPDICKIYEKFLISPNSRLSKKLLHTTYKNRNYLLVNNDLTKIN